MIRTGPSVAIVCEYGEAPRVLVWGSASLTRQEWDAIRDGVDAMWREIQVPCVCGHSFAVHAYRSHHGCSSPPEPCACSTFQAASPVLSSPDEEVITS